MNQKTIEIVRYQAEFGLEAIKMIRESFRRAMSLERNTRYTTVSNHLRFFASYDPEIVHVAIDTPSSTIAGVMVLSGHEVEQLYIHVDYQRKGIGGRFMELAKVQSPDRLELFTFQLNQQAQAFYKKHDFLEMARGTAPETGNSWATKPEQLADIRFVWSQA